MLAFEMTGGHHTRTGYWHRWQYRQSVVIRVTSCQPDHPFLNPFGHRRRIQNRPIEEEQSEEAECEPDHDPEPGLRHTDCLAVKQLNNVEDK